MRTALPWMLVAAAMIIIGTAAIYLMLWAVAWLYLQPFVGALEVLALAAS